MSDWAAAGHKVDRLTEPGRLIHIDAMRGLAACAVVYFHAAETLLGSRPSLSGFEHAILTVAVDWLNLGKLAVVLFFAISGFVIPHSLLGNDRPSLRRFAISRFFRLYPAYWFSIVVIIAVRIAFAEGHFPSAQVAANLTMLQGMIGQPDMLGVYWTLQIELIFYAICVVMFATGLLQRPAAIVRISAFWLLCALVFAIARFVLQRKIPVALPLSLSIMFWGLAWRNRLQPTATQAVRRSSTWLTVFILIAVPPIAWLAYSLDTGLGESFHAYASAYCLAMIAFMLLTTKIKIRARPLVYAGAISYSIYLFGPIAQYVVLRIFPVSIAPDLPAHLDILGIEMVTVALASVVYALVEVPALRFSKQIRTVGRKLGPR